MTKIGILIAVALTATIGCAHRDTAWVSKSFDTPGAVLGVHADAAAAKEHAEQILARAAGILGEQGYAVDHDPRWHWRYYAESRLIWFQHFIFSDPNAGTRVGHFRCNVVQALASRMWTVTVEPFPVGPRRASAGARDFYEALLSDAREHPQGLPRP